MLHLLSLFLQYLPSFVLGEFLVVATAFLLLLHAARQVSEYPHTVCSNYPDKKKLVITGF